MKTFAPDVFIADNVPKGALGELERTLGKLRKKAHTRTVLGLRDILDDPETVRQQWAEADNEATIRDYFDEVWVYGDRRVCDQARAYGFSPAVAEKLRYVGYFDQRSRLASSLRPDALPEGVQPELGKLVLAQVGGGQDGAPLARAFARTPLPQGFYGVLLTGPYMPATLKAELEALVAKNPRVTLLEFVKEPTRLLEHADRVIAMGGYNTTFEALSFAKPLLSVPRVWPRREQLVRAERLQALGLLELVHPDALTPEALGAWLARDVAPPEAHALLDFGAMNRIPEALNDLLSAAVIPANVVKVTHVAA
jgi:predicted glycosyltransferase